MWQCPRSPYHCIKMNIEFVMSTFEYICFVFIAGVIIFFAVEIDKILQRINKLKEQARDLDLRIDNLVERMKLYDKELEQIEKDIRR